MKDAERLKQLFTGINRARFARENKIPGGSALIYQHINGLAPIGLDAAIAYAKAFKCSLEKISPSLANKIRPVLSESPAMEDDYDIIPILNIRAACGTGAITDLATIDNTLAIPKYVLSKLAVTPEHARIIHAEGDSMSPTINDQSFVLINIADREPRDGRIFAIYLPYDGIVLKRLIFEYSGSLQKSVWIMRSDNPNKNIYPDKQLPPEDETTIIGKAIWRAGSI